VQATSEPGSDPVPCTRSYPTHDPRRTAPPGVEVHAVDYAGHTPHGVRPRRNETDTQAEAYETLSTSWSAQDGVAASTASRASRPTTGGTTREFNGVSFSSAGWPAAAVAALPTTHGARDANDMPTANGAALARHGWGVGGGYYESNSSLLSGTSSVSKLTQGLDAQIASTAGGQVMGFTPARGGQPNAPNRDPSIHYPLHTGLLVIEDELKKTTAQAMRIEAVGKTVTLPPPHVIPIRYKSVDKATWMHVGKWGEPPRSVDDDGNPIWVIKPARLPTNAEMSKRGDKARGSRNMRQRDLKPGTQDSMPWLHCAKYLYK